MITMVEQGHDILPLLCKAKGKWGMMCSIGSVDDIWDKADLLLGPAPWIKDVSVPTGVNPLFNLTFAPGGISFFFFDTEEEMLSCFRRTVGEDGPTKENPYDGPIRVYALTCDPEGKLLSENT